MQDSKRLKEILSFLLLFRNNYLRKVFLLGMLKKWAKKLWIEDTGRNKIIFLTYLDPW